MSALPPKADMCGATSNVGYGPIADIELFDHLVSALLKRRRYVQSERLGCLEINHEFELGRRLYRHVPGFFALKDAIDIACGSAVWVDCVRPIAEQTTFGDEETEGVGCRQSVSGCQRDDQTIIIS